MSQKIISVYMIGSIPALPVVFDIVPLKDGVIRQATGDQTTLVSDYTENMISQDNPFFDDTFNYGLCYFYTSISNVTSGKYKLNISQGGLIGSYPNDGNPSLKPTIPIPVDLTQPFQVFADTALNIKGYVYIYISTDNNIRYVNTDTNGNLTSDVTIPANSQSSLEIAWEMGPSGNYLDTSSNPLGSLFPARNLTDAAWSVQTSEIKQTSNAPFVSGSYCLAIKAELVALP